MYIFDTGRNNSISNPEKGNLNLQIGTSGYSYSDWKGVFYPDHIADNQMLKYYCQHFTTVELNVTYYRIPSISAFKKITSQTPADFQFIVKTNQETTHRRKENAAAVKLLLESVKPVEEEGKLHGFLAQFPYSFKNNEANRKYIVQTRNLLGRHDLFVEFRHESWVKDPVPGFLQTNNIGYVNVDQPALKGLLPPQDIVSGKLGYIRFHGRNGRDWWQGQGSARYDYEYREQELEEWLINISGILKKAFRTYIFFNNHPGGKAVKNARQLMEIIKTRLG